MTRLALLFIVLILASCAKQRPDMFAANDRGYGLTVSEVGGQVDYIVVTAPMGRTLGVDVPTTGTLVGDFVLLGGETVGGRDSLRFVRTR